jgi:hypothetical protein
MKREELHHSLKSALCSRVPITLRAGYVIGDGEAIFIFSGLYDLKRFREKVSGPMSEFPTA